MNVGFVSLGCSKNLVDTEMMIGLFKNNNFKIVNNPKEAEIIVINTCGFIEPAKQEAINTILEMSEYKNKKCKYLIVMGCLVERYKKDLQKLLPEVDLFLSIKEYGKAWDEISKLINIPEEGKYTNMEYLEREISTGNNMAYLKIAEGCSNRCTYCAIPSIRGPFESRKIEDVLEEAEQLAKKGVKELVVIAQDTTKYGIDLYGKPRLAELLEKLCKIDGFKWIRFLYAYPETITDELIDVVKNNEKICNYFDIPIQHISNPVLKKMNRKSNEESIKELIKKIRKEIPNVIIRTSLIVGFPGETQEDFEKLCEFVKTAKFDRMGAFTYSKEDGTPAERLPNQIHGNTKKARYNKIMKIQKEISDQKGKEKIGKIYEVLVENKSFDGKYLVGRTYMDVPDEDGVVYIESSHTSLIGKFIKVKITDYSDYDLIGKIL
jgi:ribosomal protein S12 methylthiotransferase